MNELLKLIPVLKRARGYRLYDYRGNRYLDLYQNNGHALLGHHSFGLSTVIKDVVSKGIITDLPSIYAKRLEKIVLEFIPGYRSFRIVSSMERALDLASLHLGRKIGREDICDPLLHPEGMEKSDISYWRPLLPETVSGTDSEILFPIIPFAMGCSPITVCFRHSVPEEFPDSDIITPVILAGALRTLFNIKKYRLPPWFREDLIKGTAGWIQRGIYIYPDFDLDIYKEVFMSFLKESVLLSPLYPGPSILPAEASPGEVKKMIKLFKQNPGE